MTNDTSPPELFIDFPAAGRRDHHRVHDDVAGRVGDNLSGFMGLNVTVNGVEADVDVGIGPNGTFFVPSVPLESPGQPTMITATAADEFGNSVTRTIEVQRSRSTRVRLRCSSYPETPRRLR